MSKGSSSPTKPPRPDAAKGDKGSRPAGNAPAASSGSGLQQRFQRQKATFHGRRDTSPVIFGLGRGLSAKDKLRLQRRLYFGFAGVMVVLMLAVVGYGLLYNLVITPHQPIVTVDGVQIPQYQYKNMAAYLAQDTWNQLEADTKQQNTLQTAISSNPSLTSKYQNQLNTLSTTIGSLQIAFSQTQVDQLAIDDLIEDQLIQMGTKQYEKTDPNAAKVLTVTSQQINSAFTTFKNAFPAGESYSDFKSKDGLSDQDVKNAITVILRRNAMDQYQQSLIKSPEKQVHIERIQYDSRTLALQDLNTLRKDPTQWSALAKKDSIDTNTRDSSGDLGWVIDGQQDQAIEQWAFSAQIGQISPVLQDVSGTFDIVRLLEIDPSRAVPSDTLANLKSNALSHWLTGMRDLPPTNNITAVDQGMQNSANNVPVLPSFNVSFNQATPTPTP